MTIVIAWRDANGTEIGETYTNVAPDGSVVYTIPPGASQLVIKPYED